MSEPSRSLLADLTALLDTQPRVCPIPSLLASLDEAERAAVLRAVNGKVPGARTLHDILAHNGHAIPEKRIEAHRARRCGCPSSTT